MRGGFRALISYALALSSGNFRCFGAEEEVVLYNQPVFNVMVPPARDLAVFSAPLSLATVLLVCDKNQDFIV